MLPDRLQSDWPLLSKALRKLTGRRRAKRSRKTLFVGSVILGGAACWAGLSLVPSGEVVVIPNEEAAERFPDPLIGGQRTGLDKGQLVGVGTRVNYERLESRERLRDWQQQPEQVLAAMGLKPGQTIADVGAGSGYFTYLFSDVVGARGRVWAVEISQKAVDFLNGRTEARPPPHPNIQIVHSREDDVGLASDSLDWAFLSNVHLMVDEAPDPDDLACLESIYRALKPGGRLAVIESERREVSTTQGVSGGTATLGRLDESTVSASSKTEDQAPDIAQDELISRYEQAGFHFVEGYDFLRKKSGGAPVVIESATPSVGEGGQFFFILDKR